MAADYEQSAVMNDINVTPLIDVMLVLLIIFMVVTPALLAGFQAQLPEAVNLKKESSQNRLTLGIDAKGRYYLNRQHIPKADAPALLAAAMARRPKDKVLFLKADESLPYSEVVKALQMARTAGVVVVAAVGNKVGGSSSSTATAPAGAGAGGQ